MVGGGDKETGGPNAQNGTHGHNGEGKLPGWNCSNFMGNCPLISFQNLGLYQAIHMVNPFMLSPSDI